MEKCSKIIWLFVIHTKDMKLVYKKPENVNDTLNVEIYVDANFNDPHLKNKSRSGYFDFCRRLFSWMVF